MALHGLMTRGLDAHGRGSAAATERFLRWMREYDPDVIHLHNLHGYYLHIGRLFEALAELDKPMVWTLHDCWAFTGHCAHYTAAGCEKWKTGCYACVQKRTYPASWCFDSSRRSYGEKRRLFTMPRKITIVTPSNWLGSQVAASFLSGFPVEVIPNGIDLAVFRPTASGLRRRYGLENRHIVLCVASVWTEQKGLGRLTELARRLDGDWVVVAIGLTKSQARFMPGNILPLPRIQDQSELAQWYSAADVCVSVSLEESMGMTMAEAIACGTPVAAFRSTANEETVGPDGILADSGDMDQLAEAVRRIEKAGKGAFPLDAKRFDVNIQNRRYYELYRRIYKEGSI